MKLIVKRIGIIGDIQDKENLVLVTDYENVERLKEYLGDSDELNSFNGFFVVVKDGDYSEIYAFEGSIPYLTKSLWKVTVKGK